MKVFNLKGLGILIAVLIVFQLVFGLILSPFVGKIVVEVMNKNSDSKIEVGRISVWPLTLGISISGLKIYDPDDDKKKIISVKKASVRLSPLALLAKRLVVAGISASDVIIDLEGEPDGSFNVAKIVKTEESPDKPKGSIFDRFKKDKDMYSKIYNMLKDKGATESKEEVAEERKEARKVKTDVIELPKGRRVVFKTKRDDYLVEVRKVNIRLATITVQDASGQEIDIDRAGLAMAGIKVDPVKGVSFDSLDISGQLKKKEENAGSFKLSYDTDETRDGVRMDADLSAKNVDLAAVSFLFADSLPVIVDKGTINVYSKTSIVNGALNSRNKLTLSDHTLEPKGKGNLAGIIPAPVLCEALNEVDPLKLKFDVTGTLDNPQFTGLEQTIQEIAEPYLTKQLESTAKSALEGFMKKDAGGEAAAGGEGASAEEKAQQAIDSIKSLFNKE